MKQDMKLGYYESTALIVTLIITKVLISAPSLYISHSKSAGWLEVLISGIFEIFVLAIILKLSSNFPNMDVMDISHFVFGKWGRVITGIVCIIIVTVSAAAVFRSFAELIRNTIMNSIPYENVAFFLLAGAITAAYLGLKTQMNVVSFIAPIILISMGVIFLINAPRYTLTNIQPYLGTGLPEITKNALLKNSSFFEIGIILFLFPYFNDKSAVKRISFSALLMSVIIFTIITLIYQLSIPYEAGETFAVPLYQMTRMIKANTFFQRIEPLNMFLWSGAMLVYISVGTWLSAHIFRKTFSTCDQKPVVLIFSLIICLIALIPGSETSVEKIYDFLITYSYIAYPLLPMLLLILALTFKKNGDASS